MCPVFMNVIFRLLNNVYSTVFYYSFPPIIIRLRFFGELLKCAL